MAATNKQVWQTATVTELQDVATNIRRIGLTVSKPKPAHAGSHIDVSVVVNGRPDTRSYSVVESAEGGRKLVISVLEAPMSRGGSVYMHSLREGDEIEITQPLQNFPLRAGASRYVLVAGGIGITAVSEMARVLHRQGADYRLVYAGRTRPAMAYLEPLAELHGDRLHAHVDEEDGLLDVPGIVASSDADTELYVCGPIRLMDAVRRAWLDAELPQANLRYETFGNSGWFAASEFTVRIPRLGVEATVGTGQSMLQALEDAGVDMMSDCRKGECGLCEVKLLDIDGIVDHRDVFYSARQRSTNHRMCVCVSRITPSASTADSPTPTVTIDVS